MKPTALTADVTRHGNAPEAKCFGGIVPFQAAVARAGVEPATFRFSGGRSYQLSYLAVLHRLLRDERSRRDLNPRPPP